MVLANRRHVVAIRVLVPGSSTLVSGHRPCANAQAHDANPLRGGGESGSV